MYVHQVRYVFIWETPYKYCYPLIKQYKFLISVFFLKDLFLSPSHHILALLHISKSSNLLKINFSRSSDPSNCISLMLSKQPENNDRYLPLLVFLSSSMSLLNTQWELLTTKAGKFDNLSLMMMLVVGLFISQMVYWVCFLFETFYTNFLNYLDIFLVPGSTVKTEQTFNSSFYPSYPSLSYYSSSYSSSSSSQSSSSAKITFPIYRFQTTLSAIYEFVNLVFSANLRSIVFKE